MVMHFFRYTYFLFKTNRLKEILQNWYEVYNQLLRDDEFCREYRRNDAASRKCFLVVFSILAICVTENFLFDLKQFREESTKK